MELDLNNLEFQTALSLIQETNQSFFITGRAGTGKSTFLKYIVQGKAKNYVVVAPTGIAAVNVGGVTIHSLFRFPHSRPLLIADKDIKIFHKKSAERNLIAKMDTLIIDEISMVRVDVLDAIDFSLRQNGGSPNLPFGGKQVIFVGDIFQLEPVLQKGSEDERIINDVWGSAYFYQAKVFEQVKLITVELQKVYRQSDPDFINLLNKVREKNTTKQHIDRINSRIISVADLERKKNIITLTTRNDIADKENATRLEELRTEPFSYYAEVSGDFPESKFPTIPEIVLKKDAQIIFIKNDPSKHWVNGTIAQVSELTENTIKVKLEDGTIYEVEKRTWENYKYFYDKKANKIDQEVIGTFRQYPLKLAWAITIHKSQGMTMENVIIDIGTGTFASGQAYVALSRVTSFDGLFLKKKMQSTDIHVDAEIKEFAKTFNDKEAINEALSDGKRLYQLKKNNDYEKIGELYFDEAIARLVNGNFKVAFDGFISGFTYVTCDCHLSSAMEKKEAEINASIKSNPINCTSDEFDFIRAVTWLFLYHRTTKDTKISRALPLIDSYLESNPESEIGHYIRARIVNNLGNTREAMHELENALAIQKTARVHYRIARIKEDHLSEFGIDHLLQAYLLNPSSICCWVQYCLKSDKRRIKLKTFFQRIISSFNQREELDLIRQAHSVELFGDAVTYTIKGLDVGELLQRQPILEELTPIQKDGKWGYCSKEGNLVIDCIYEQAMSFEGLLAAVNETDCENVGWGFINAKGEYVIRPDKYKTSYDDVKNGLFGEGLAPVRKSNDDEGDDFGYVDFNGKEVTEFKYYSAHPFVEGLARVSLANGPSLHDENVDELWGYIDKTGNEVIPLIYDSAQDFSSEGLASVQEKWGKYGYIDKEGKVVVPFMYDDAHPFTQGIAAVRENQMWGYIDARNRTVLPFTFEYAIPFENIDFSEVALIKRSSEWLYIDKKGKPVINWMVFTLRNYVVRQQEALTQKLIEEANTPELKEEAKKIVGVFVVPVFNSKHKIFKPRLDSSNVIYKAINQKESQLLVMSVDPLSYDPNGLYWKIPSKLDVKASFIEVPTSSMQTKYKTGYNIGGKIITKYLFGLPVKGNERHIMFGSGTDIPCVNPEGEVIYCKQSWTNEEGVINDEQPEIANLDDIKLDANFGYIDSIQGLWSNDFYYKNEMEKEYESGSNSDEARRAAEREIRAMDIETDGFWRDL